MPHVTFIPLVGVRVREEELLALGMSLPGLGPRAAAVSQLPALGLLVILREKCIVPAGTEPGIQFAGKANLARFAVSVPNTTCLSDSGATFMLPAQVESFRVVVTTPSGHIIMNPSKTTTHAHRFLRSFYRRPPHS